MFLVAAALLIAACNNENVEPIPELRPLLEVEYTNYAWVPTWVGYVVGSGGEVVKYDRKGAPWPSAEKTSGTITSLNRCGFPRKTLARCPHKSDRSTLLQPHRHKAGVRMPAICRTTPTPTRAARTREFCFGAAVTSSPRTLRLQHNS